MNRVEEWTVEQELSGTRLDSALNTRFSDISRSLAQDMLKTGEITVNGKNCKPGLKLKGGELVRVSFRSEEPLRIEATELDFPVIFEDEHIIVIDKPSGLVVHPGAGREKTTVVSALLGHSSLSPIGAPERPGVVHRLDKETSGVMVLAKTRESHQKLAKMFASHLIEKEYYALIQGHIVNKKGRIEVAIERDPVHRKRMKATSAEKGRMATSLFEVEEYLNGATLVKVRILTGRTHQIRVHMAFTGHPLLGDVIYGGKKFDKNVRHFLHSNRLAFNHPINGKSLVFSVKMPQSFAEVVARLKGEEV